MTAICIPIELPLACASEKLLRKPCAWALTACDVPSADSSADAADEAAVMLLAESAELRL
jgi:hypothetical protein